MEDKEKSAADPNLTLQQESPIKNRLREFMNENSYLIQNSEVEGDISLVQIEPLQTNAMRKIVGVIIGFLGFLIPLILSRWNIPFRSKLFYNKLLTKQLSQATHFLVKFSDGSYEIVIAQQFNPTQNTFFADQGTKAFRAKKLIYAFDPQKFHFAPLELTLFKEMNQEQILQRYNQNPNEFFGLTLSNAANRLKVFGKCMIEIDIPNLFIYMAEEMTTPLYMIQYCAILVWILEKFFLAAILMITFTTLLTILNYFYFRSTMLKLRAKAVKIQKIQVYRSSNQNAYQNTNQAESIPFVNQVAQDIELQSQQAQLMVVNSDELVPGDLLVLQDQMLIPADCILISGEVFVNEVTLTGESVPVPKQAILKTDQNYVENQKLNTKSLLYEGTIIVKTRPVNNNITVAIVQRTGFTTFKGQIFRSLVFVTTKTALFQTTAGWFILMIAIFFLLICFILLVQFLKIDIPPLLVVIKIADMIIYVAPPAVPIMTTFCLTMSLARLRMDGIFGINPQSLLQACKVTTCCFDKTGTLTEMHLDFNSFIPVEDSKLLPQVEFTSNPSREGLAYLLFASCHSIILDNYGEQLGDPLDIKMFSESGFEINKQGVIQKGGKSIQILQSYPFSSDDQCMSVVMKFDDQEYTFVKGSPEKLQKISNSVPEDFEKVLNTYTMQGLRVLGIGYKKGSSGDKRQDAESNLEFLGFMVFVNRLKHDTAEVLNRLKMAQYKVKMISGDNSLTCAQTAKNASIVSQDAQFIIIEQEQGILYVREIKEQSLQNLDSFTEGDLVQWVASNQYLQMNDREFVMNGNVLEKLLEKDDEVILRLILKTALFGRCRPEHKAMVINALRKLGVVCSMVGDGANDCPAIKAANLGVSFSETDASISAPFSSMSPSLTCLEKIIMESKCTTQNSVEALRYYATTGIHKYVVNALLIFELSWISQFQVIFMAYVFGTIIFNVFFGLNKPVNEITIYAPNDDLLDPLFIFTFFVHEIIGCLGFIIIYAALINQDFYQLPIQPEDELSMSSMANSALLGYAYILTVTTLVAMYFSKPFKQSLYRNYILSICLIIKLIYCIIFIFKPKLAMKQLEFVAYDSWFAWVIIAVSLGIFLVLYPVEYILQQYHLKRMIESFRKRGF